MRPLARLINNQALVSSQSRPVLKGLQYEIQPYQILVEVSLTPPGTTALPSDAQVFPALIDTGQSAGFTIGHRQLREWSGLDPSQFGTAKSKFSVTLASGERIANLPRYYAYLWLHSNLPHVPPRKLWLSGGFVFYGAKSASTA